MQTHADRDRNHLYEPFRDAVHLVMVDLKAYVDAGHMPGYDGWMLVEGLRSAEYQHSLWEQGRTRKGTIITQRDGFNHPSNHQSALAGDIVPTKNGEPVWDDVPDEFWAYLGHCARAHGLDWGGDWHGFKDIDHVEWKPTDTATYAAARAWIKAEGLA